MKNTKSDDGNGFSGAYARSKDWQPPADPLALELVFHSVSEEA